MIVYVESNFVLELAFLQEHHEQCDKIISLAASRQIDLVIPTISLTEPYETLTRRARQRSDLQERLTRELRELSRSEPYSEISERSRDITALLVRSGEEEKGRLDATLGQLLEHCEIIPIGSNTLRAAIAFQESYGLQPQDSIVFASISDHLCSALAGPKCFLNRDSKDFLNPDIVQQLTDHDCRLITSFADGLGYIQHSLNA